MLSLFGTVRIIFVASFLTPAYPTFLYSTVRINVVESMLSAPPRRRRSYGVVSLLSVTKWLHLVHGDQGLLEAFHKCKRLLQVRAPVSLETLKSWMQHEAGAGWRGWCGCGYGAQPFGM